MDLASDITAEDIEVFLQETDEQLQGLDENIVRLEHEKDNPELLQEIFRISHTLKGSAAMFGHQQMTGLAHAMENLFDHVRKGSIEVSTQVIDALLHSLDILLVLKNDLANSEDSEVDIAPAVAELEAATNDALGVSDAARTETISTSLTLDQTALQRMQTAQIAGLNVFRVQVDLELGTAWASVRCFQVLQGVGLVGDIISSQPTAEDVEAERVALTIQVLVSTEYDADTVRNPLTVLEDVASVVVEDYDPEAAAAEAAAKAAPEAVKTPTEAAPEARATNKGSGGDPPVRRGNNQTQTVRIDVERLDNLMNTIGELVIDRTRILQISKLLESKYKDDDLIQSLGETSAHVAKVVDELQEDIMRARMLPIGTVFSGFPRMVRDLAQKIGKKVEFIVEGQDTEIDRTVIERIRDPLVHLLRNAVDHGVETPEDRQAAGKSEIGTLRLSANHEHGQIVITVQDDGKGIDAEKIKESAINKGIITADAASRLSEAEAIDLIFAPGFSTAAQTTDISGRGVGMDIVKTNIEAINGFVRVDTKVGEGSKFTMMLPLTLATIQALLFGLDQTVYAVPLVYVLEAVKLDPGDINTIEGKEVIRLRGTIVPVLRLGDLFNPGSGAANSDARTTNVVVVRLGDRLIGLAVDSLREIQEVTAKSLGTYMGEIKGIAGVSILGDGQVVLILDVPTLINTTVSKGLDA